MPEYTLYYFPTRGKAEAIRLLFHYKGIPFEDVRLSDQEWVSKKSSVPFGQLPVLVEDGKQIAQSWAIMRHLAHKFGKYIQIHLNLCDLISGLDGKDEEERVFIDQVSELARDYLDSAILYLAVIFGFVEGDKVS
jgi:glutathione S-transferase